MRLERHDGYWLLIGPAAPGATATTLGPLILMRPRGVGDARLLRHELEHVRQWRRYGVIGFLWRYLGAYLRWRARGYGHLGCVPPDPLRDRGRVAGPPGTHRRRGAGDGSTRRSGPPEGSPADRAPARPGRPAVGG